MIEKNENEMNEKNEKIEMENDKYNNYKRGVTENIHDISLSSYASNISSC